jgi:hypothetical protein
MLHHQLDLKNNGNQEKANLNIFKNKEITKERTL